MQQLDAIATGIDGQHMDAAWPTICSLKHIDRLACYTLKYLVDGSVTLVLNMETLAHGDTQQLHDGSSCCSLSMARCVTS